MKEYTPKKISIFSKFGEITFNTGGGIHFKWTDGHGFKLMREVKNEGLVEILNYSPADSDTLVKFDEKTAYNVGDVLPDGWIVGPVSRTTGNPIAIEPIESALKGHQTWEGACKHVEELSKQGHLNVRNADYEELTSIFNVMVKHGRNKDTAFETSELAPDGSKGYPWAAYWSSPDKNDLSSFARAVFFDRGLKQERWSYPDSMMLDVSSRTAQVRCVRDEPDLYVPRPYK